MIKDRLKVLARTAAYAVGVAGAASGAEPLCWERVPNRPAPAQFDTFHGETLDFRCTFAGFGALPFSEGGDVRLWYQTNGMGAAWWSVPATVSSNTVAATFPPSADPGAERLAVFFGAPSNAYAAAQVRFRNSPGPHPNDLEPPSVLDWQAELSAAIDALWASSAAAFMPKTNAYTKAETDDRIEQLAPRTSLSPATNYTDQAIGAFAATGTVNQATTASYATDAGSANIATTAQVAERLGDPDTSEVRTAAQIFAALDSKVTTNDVCNIVTNVVTEYGHWSAPGLPWYEDISSNYTGLALSGFWEIKVDGQEAWNFEYADCEDGEILILHLIDEDFIAPWTATSIAITIDQTSYTLTRSAKTRNALGLARLTDVPSTNGLATAADISRAVGSFADTGTVYKATEATDADYASNAGSASAAQTAESAFALQAAAPYYETRTAAQIFAALDSKVTTNDVCNIVTNETQGGWSEWVITPSSLTDGYYVWYPSSMPSYDSGIGAWSMSFDTPEVPGSMAAFSVLDFTSPQDATELHLSGNGYNVTATRAYLPARNALGLARLTDVPSTNGLATKVYVDEAIAAAGGGEWVETNVTATLRFVTGYEHITVPSGGTLTADVSDWPNGAALMVDLVPGGTYTVSGITMIGYQTWPTNRAEMVVFRSGVNVFANVILTY